MPIASVILDESLRYPAAGDAFSPGQRYPEYRYGTLSRRPNHVYQAVRQAFAQAMLDKDRLGSPQWNPLGTWIKPGQKVFVLCNFVYHRRANESCEAFLSKCTHASVIRALIDYVLLAVGESGSVQFGNAPLQSCRWDAVLRDTGAAEVLAFYKDAGAPVQAQDLRLFVAPRNAWGLLTGVERRSENRGLAIDLAGRSLLAPLDSDSTRYRVLDYDPARTDACHGRGKHIYVVNKAVLESDVVVSVPKLKTHEKVGITCTIKGCVGAIGHKDSLAHHRQGPPSMGGDEYPRDPLGILRALSRLHDRVYAASPDSRGGRALRVLDRILRKGAGKLVTGTGGGWWGNDTAWRMAVDIARIVRHADRQGLLHDQPQRVHIAMVDGVVGGEGTGPLKPSPVNTGAVLFSDSLVAADTICAILMGYPPEALPMIREARRLESLPLAAGDELSGPAVVNGQTWSLERLRAAVKHKYAPPPGWAARL
ncbi:MAG: DUF362 domain-containing protein [Phycisphaerae bacterium]